MENESGDKTRQQVTHRWAGPYHDRLEFIAPDGHVLKTEEILALLNLAYADAPVSSCPSISDAVHAVRVVLSRLSTRAHDLKLEQDAGGQGQSVALEVNARFRELGVAQEIMDRLLATTATAGVPKK